MINKSEQSPEERSSILEELAMDYLKLSFGVMVIAFVVALTIAIPAKLGYNNPLITKAEKVEQNENYCQPVNWDYKDEILSPGRDPIPTTKKSIKNIAKKPTSDSNHRQGNILTG